MGVGNGAISSLANALKSLGIDLDVADYKEHAIGEGKDVKAATYIECTASGNANQKVWGVGIHEDVVQASLTALLSAASSVSFTDLSASKPRTPNTDTLCQFLSSRPSTPIPFRPKRSNTQNLDVSPLAKSTLLKMTGAGEAPKENGMPSVVEHLEGQLNGA